MQLWKCCNYPYLFDGMEGDEDNTSLFDLISSSGKMAVLDSLFRILFQKNHHQKLMLKVTHVVILVVLKHQVT